MNRLLRSISSSVRQTSQDKASQKGMYRFLNNEQVSEEALIASCCERTSLLCGGKHLLVINDTTDINLQSHAGRLRSESGVGTLGQNSGLGFFAHVGLVLDIEAHQAIGYSSMQLWHRPVNNGTKESRGYDKLPVEQKESYKWIQCAIDSQAVLAEAASVTLVGDRESDMYELFTDATSRGMHLVVRNRINRRTEEGKLLYDALADTPVSDNYTISLTGDIRKQTTKRTATLSVKYKEVQIVKPWRKDKADGRPVNLKAWIVEAREEGKPTGICWRLLTTHPVISFEQAVQIIEWYQMRWFIEEVFRLLKSKGYKIEDSQIESGWAVRKLTVMLLHNILRVMQMLVAYKSDEKQTAGLTFTEDEITCLTKVCKTKEGKTDKLKNEHPPGTLKWATWIIARLGGWTGYQSQRPPGPITLKNGLDKFNNMYEGWLLAKDVGTQ